MPPPGREAAAGLLGTDLSAAAWDQATLPGPLGGLAIRQVSSLDADAAFWATWEDLRPRVRTTAIALGRPLATDPARAEAEQAAARLCQRLFRAERHRGDR